MATPAVHGTELARIDTLTERYVHCSDGHILRNEGGWRLWRKVANPVEHAEKIIALQAKLAKDYPARQAYKLALHRVASLDYRAAITENLAQRWVGRNWPDYTRLQPSLEQWRELDRLYRAMEKESRATRWKLSKPPLPSKICQLLAPISLD